MKATNLRKIPAVGRIKDFRQKLYLLIQIASVKQFFLIFFIFLVSSCFNDNDCLKTATNYVKIDLKTLTGAARTTTFTSVRTADSTLIFPDYQATNPVTSLVLPIDQTGTERSFILDTTDSSSYRLTLGYTSFTRVISADCGAYLYFKDLKVVDTNFDSTRVTNPQLFTGVKQNIKIFF